MLKKLYSTVDKYYSKKIDGTGLAYFRIAFCIIQLFEVIQLYYFRHLVYDKIPYLDKAEINFSYPLIFWMISLVMIIFGFKTKLATILNYVISFICIATITTYEYHMFYVYIGVNLMLIFLPISTCFSVDRLLLKLKYSTSKYHHKPTKRVSSLAYYLPVLFGIAFVYLDSIFYKLTSHNWMNGLGMWLPASLPQATHFDSTFLMNLKWLIIGLGYVTVVFELVFPFLFWFKKWRLPLLVIGIGLHFGILLEFPIPLFALGVIAIYLLMVPVGYWNKKSNRKRESSLSFFYDIECPLCTRTKIVINHFDSKSKIDFLSIQNNKEHEAIKNIDEENLYSNIYSCDKKQNLFVGLDTYKQVFKRIKIFYPLYLIFSIPGLSHLAAKVYSYVAKNRNTDRCTDDNCGYTPPNLPEKEQDIKLLKNLTLKDLRVYGLTSAILLMFFFQIAVSYNTPYFKKVRKNIGFEKTMIGKGINSLAIRSAHFSKEFAGITAHSVFMDGHFNNYNHIIAVTYNNENGDEIFLPIINEKGNPSSYITGFNWVRWTFRANAPNINQTRLNRAVRDFTAFWATKNGVSLEDATFNIKVKKVDIPKEWKKDFLRNQMAHPWLDGGSVRWQKKEFVSNIKDIEKI